MAVFKSRFAGGSGRGGGGVAPRDFHGVDMARIKVKIPTTALDSNDEQVLLYKFPDDGDCFLVRGDVRDLRVNIDTIDSGTSAVWDLGVGDSDGVIDTPLIANATAGQSTAGTDSLDAAGDLLDVSGKYLIFDVTTAASTAVSGDIAVDFKVLFGKRQEYDSGVS
jgi:hypothetical protein